MLDRSALATRRKWLRIISLAAVGSLIPTWIIVRLIRPHLEGFLLEVIIGFAGLYTYLALFAYVVIAIYERTNQELKQYIREERAEWEAKHATLAQVKGEAVQTLHSALYGLAWGVMFAAAGGFLTILDIFGGEYCAPFIYLAAVVLFPSGDSRLAVDSKAHIGYVVGLALVWIPTLFLIFYR